MLDIAELRVVLEKSAHEEGLRWYGDGKRDDLQDGQRYAKALHSVWRQYADQPDSWTRMLSYLANSTMFSPDEITLRTNLIKIAAFTVAWIEDIDRRDIPGYTK